MYRMGQRGCLLDAVDVLEVRLQDVGGFALSRTQSALDDGLGAPALVQHMAHGQLLQQEGFSALFAPEPAILRGDN